MPKPPHEITVTLRCEEVFAIQLALACLVREIDRANPPKHLKDSRDIIQNVGRRFGSYFKKMNEDHEKEFGGRC